MLSVLQAKAIISEISDSGFPLFSAQKKKKDIWINDERAGCETDSAST